MDVGPGGLRKRAMEVESSDATKRRKIESEEVIQSSSSDVHNLNRCCCLLNLPEKAVSPSSAMSGTSCHCSTSPCLSNESSEFVERNSRSSDLKAEVSETDISTFVNAGFREKTSPSSDLHADSDGMESSSTTTKKPSPDFSPRKPSSSAGIEEFFSTLEKYDLQRFADKYNFDFVNGVPLEGRYQWVRINHDEDEDE